MAHHCRRHHSQGIGSHQVIVAHKETIVTSGFRNEVAQVSIVTKVLCIFMVRNNARMALGVCCNYFRYFLSCWGVVLAYDYLKVEIALR